MTQQSHSKVLGLGFEHSIERGVASAQRHIDDGVGIVLIHRDFVEVYIRHHCWSELTMISGYHGEGESFGASHACRY